MDYAQDDETKRVLQRQSGGINRAGCCVAMRLQRAWDDEDALASQLSTSFNFLAPRNDFPQQTTSTAGASGSNARADEIIARRLQRNFYLDLKKQGLGDLDIASMLDAHQTHDQPVYDEELQLALQASLGEQMPSVSERPPENSGGQSFVEKSRRRPPTSTRSFRSQVIKSVHELADGVGGAKLLEAIAEKVLPSARDWDEFESAFFILTALCDRLNSADVLAYGERLVQSITHVKHDLNPILVNTTTRFASALSGLVSYNEDQTVALLRWLLNTPPYEVLLRDTSEAIERVFFSPIHDFLPFVELAKENGDAMEHAALCLLRACSQIANGQPNERMFELLKVLVKRPVEELNAMTTNGKPIRSEPSGHSWHQLAEQNPFLWLSRLSAIFENVRPRFWDEYASNEEQKPEDNPPWEQLALEVSRCIANVMTMFTVIDANYGVNSVLVNFFQNHIEILRVVEQLFDRNLLVTETSPFLSPLHANIPALSGTPEAIAQNVALINQLYVLLLVFARLRLSEFLTEPILETVFEVAIFGLEVEAAAFHANARDFCLLLVQFQTGHAGSETLQAAADALGAVFARQGDRLLQKCVLLLLGDGGQEPKDSAACVLSELIWARKEELEPSLSAALQQALQSNQNAVAQIPTLVEHLLRSIQKSDVLDLFEQFKKELC
ncbi:hypothetical protein M3Y99_00196300 [Aphelenchoides fujianensis]|nr:hypothetical protein M3Y99_00196300 [Aphelenchoides fujianensis]